MPDGVISIAVATPDKEFITIHVTVVDQRGETVVVPYVWQPSTGVCKRIYPETWRAMGIVENVQVLVSRVQQKAFSEHRRRAERWATLDLFDDE